MLFPQATYIQRREALRQLVGNGLIVLPGNNESPMNYPANTYKFRQDSTFLYFFGQHRDGLVGVIDADTVSSLKTAELSEKTRAMLEESLSH